MENVRCYVEIGRWGIEFGGTAIRTSDLSCQVNFDEPIEVRRGEAVKVSIGGLNAAYCLPYAVQLRGRLTPPLDEPEQDK